MTAEDIFNRIDNQSVNKEMGIKLIENYGIRCKRAAIEEQRKKCHDSYPERKKGCIKRISAMLDELEKLMEVCS